MDIPDSYPASADISSLETEVVPAPKALGLVQKFGFKFPQFISLDKRLESFADVTGSDEKKKNFALAGFFFMEPVDETYKDCLKVRCFSCGLKLISNRSAYSLSYHLYISKKCPYLQMVIPTFRYNKALQKFKDVKKFYPFDSKQLLACDLMSEEEDEQKRCSVCLIRKIQVLFLPCQHLACCRMCNVYLKRCPICRERIMAITFPIF